MLLFWPVSPIDIQRIMHGFLVDGHKLAGFMVIYMYTEFAKSKTLPVSCHNLMVSVREGHLYAKFELKVQGAYCGILLYTVLYRTDNFGKHKSFGISKILNSVI